jgi:hypothetical protein
MPSWLGQGDLYLSPLLPYIMQWRGWGGGGAERVTPPGQQSPRRDEMNISNENRLYSALKNFTLLNQIEGRTLEIIISLKSIVSVRNNHRNCWPAGVKKYYLQCCYVYEHYVLRTAGHFMEGHIRDRSVLSSLIC